jgi:hypothetical protein
LTKNPHSPRPASTTGSRPVAGERLRLPRQLANDGKALVVVDVAELAHKPMPAVTAMLKARIEALQAG